MHKEFVYYLESYSFGKSFI